MSAIRALSLLALAVPLVTAVVLAGCGDDKGGDEGAPSEVQSGVVEGSIEFRLTVGGAGQTDASRISFSGPFEGEDANQLPSFDLAVSMEESGEEDVDFGMIATADAGYIEFQGQRYKLDHAGIRAA